MPPNVMAQRELQLSLPGSAATPTTAMPAPAAGTTGTATPMATEERERPAEVAAGVPGLAAGVVAGLNAPQADAVAYTSGPLLVFAGAGSGKTRVITYRVANLVARERVPPYRILAVTFTNKAAQEMSHRLRDMLGEAARDVWVGTFHATCAKLLRRHGTAVGVASNFVIYDSSDQKSVMTRVLRELELDERRYPPRMVLGRVHKEKQEGRRPEQMNIDSYMDEAIQKAYRKYQEALQAAAALDFEDLILRTLDLCESKTPEADAVLRKFSHVLVDEFQDTNATQYALLRALSSQTNNLCVVGDDDQSIYRWRGADVRNIRGFRSDYPNARVVKLEQNYRSTQTIVAAALGIIARSSTREPKELWTSNAEGDPIISLGTSDERDEAAHVVAGIHDARASGISMSDIAVFYRVHAQSRVLEEALRAANLPYQIVGGTKFYERAEIKDALSYLRLLVNPASDVDMLRIINSPPRGIGQTTVERLASLASSRGEPIFETLGAMDAMEPQSQASGKPLFQASAKKRLGQLQVLLRNLKEASSTLLPHELFDRVIAQTGYRAALEADDSAENEARLENLAELRGSIEDYGVEAEARGESPTIQGFLERVSLQSDTDDMNETERVTLMTVHGAKGLEFQVVFLTGMEEDMFPYRGMNDSQGMDREQLDEERRLAYVAVTRARSKLIVTHASARQIFGTTRWSSASRFLSDIPPELIEERMTPQARGASAGGRYIDGSSRARVPTGRFEHPQSLGPVSPPPRAPARPTPPPGERYVDDAFFDDSGEEGEVLRRGSKVLHVRFGEGEVRKVLDLGEPAVVAYFPGWGEMKVLARFLKAR